MLCTQALCIQACQQIRESFRFCHNTSNFSDNVLLESVNDIWFECHRLKANFAKHSKKIPRENKAPARSKPKTAIRVSISERDVRSTKRNSVKEKRNKHICLYLLDQRITLKTSPLMKRIMLG